MAYQSRNSLSFSSVSQFNFSDLPLSQSHSFSCPLPLSLSFSPFLWRIAARHNDSTNTQWSVTVVIKHLFFFAKIVSGGGWHGLSNISKQKLKATLTSFFWKTSAYIFIGDSTWKSHINSFGKPMRSIYGAVPQPNPQTQAEHSPCTNDQPRSAPTSCLPCVIMCSAALKTKARQNLLHHSAMNRRAGQRPQHVFALFVPSNYIYT